RGRVAGDPGGHLRAAEHVVVDDGGRVGADGEAGDVLEGHRAAARRVDQHVAELGQVAARLRRAPDHHVEDLRLLVEVAYDQARGERGRVPADVGGPQAVLLRGGEVDLDGHGRL